MCKRSCFYNSFPFFSKKLVSFNHFKRSKTFQLQGKTWNWIKEVFFSDFSMVTAWYMTMLVASETPWSRIWHLSFAQRKNKDSILTETHINHDQTQHKIHIRNNWLGPIFFSPEDSHTKGLLVLLHLGLECITEVDIDTKGGFVSPGYYTPSNDRVLSFCIFFFYKNVVQKLKLNKIHTTVSRQQYCVLTAEIKIPYNNYKNQENKED